MLKRILLLCISIMLLFSMSVCAVDTYGGYNMPVDVTVNGNFIKCVQKPIMVDDTTYIPLRAFSDSVGGTILWDGSKRAATMEKDGHSFMFYVDTNVCFVDGIEKDYSSIIYQDLTFIPLRAVSEVLGYTVEWDDLYLTVKISAPGVEVLEACKDYSYQFEDVLYLGKIIQIESGYQPFAVKLAVGNTVVNRMKSSKFPNTIKGVVLDTKYGVQFPPAHTDRINVTPSKECMIAAKCALGGADIVGNALYFIDVKSAPSSWVHNNRPHCATVGSMSFYE